MKKGKHRGRVGAADSREERNKSGNLAVGNIWQMCNSPVDRIGKFLRIAGWRVSRSPWASLLPSLRPIKWGMQLAGGVFRFFIFRDTFSGYLLDLCHLCAIL